ncbi:MAG: Na+/H+ antiporter NhaC family protein, partial [Myxococcota bacterium]|nr:Na+/H+ antiporter NhaC family protein [Myxococcota bacterium]
AFVAAGAEDYTFSMLFVASVVGTVSVFVLAMMQRILSFRECASAWIRGVLAMLPAIGILVLAMSIRGAVNDLMAAQVMVALLGDISPVVLPLVIFVLAGVVAFATGTSFATILLLVPVAIPLTAELTAGHPDQALLLALVGASVLDGAIFGDHCSPISDTTVMSSVASGCDHVSHVKTQIPYALLAMLVAASMGYLLVAWTGGAAFWLTYPIGGMMFVGILRWIGSDPSAPITEGDHEQSP